MQQTKQIKEMKETFKNLTEDNKEVVLMMAKAMRIAQKESKVK